jgi:putative toxin-antitoxin system antitoxin component (TIGR02293 family)
MAKEKRVKSKATAGSTSVKQPLKRSIAETTYTQENDPINIFKEDGIAYGKSYVAPVGLNNSFGRAPAVFFNAGRPEWKLSAVEKMEMVRAGVSKEKLEALKRRTNLDYDRLSDILATTRATLINKKGAELFSASLSEKIISIADVYSYGFDVFEDEAKFKQWIFRPNQALGGKQPFELLDNQFGREEVKNLIGRIEYGVYS